ncbi:MAG: sodium transporter, partial [Bacteroidota bacterium]
IRYSGKGVLPLRVLKALYYGTLINCVVMAMVLVAAVRIAEVFLPWHEWLAAGLFDPIVGFVAAIGLDLGGSVTGLAPDIATANNLISILLILGFTALYSTTGGLRSVIATDVLQFGLAMAGTLFYGVLVIREAGGLGGIVDRIVDLYGVDLTNKMLSFGAPSGELLMPFLIVIALQWLFQMNSDGTGYLAQRSMACKTDRDARIAGILFTWAQVLVRSLFWLLIGVGVLVLYPFDPAQMTEPGFVASREILFVTGIDDLLPPGIRGLMLTGLLAALASTLDTHLNWGASYWSNDIYSRLVCQEWRGREASSRELVIAARLSNILILVIALAIMVNLGSIQEAWTLSLLFGAGMGAVLILRWLWERINLYSELASIVVSIVVAFILLNTVEEEWLRLLIMAVSSTVAAVGITFVTPATDERLLTGFYRRVQPMGWWSKTAAAAGDDASLPMRDFRSRMGVTLVSAASLFCLLIGLGRLLFQAPASSTVVTWIFLIAGLALIPVWWVWGVRAEDVGVQRNVDRPSTERIAKDRM